jgi:hypothetical protein
MILQLQRSMMVAASHVVRKKYHFIMKYSHGSQEIDFCLSCLRVIFFLDAFGAQELGM